MKSLATLTAVAALWTTGQVQAQSWSGVYWSGNRTTFTSVELVQTTGGAVAGRFKEHRAGAGGKLEVLDAPVTGAVAGNTFVGKIEAKWFEGGAMAVSGKRSGERVELNGPGSFRATLFKSNEREVARMLHRFAEYVQHGEQERVWAAEQSNREAAGTKRVEGLTKLIQQSKLYIEQGSQTFTQFQDHPAQYAATTTKLRNMSFEWQSVGGDTGDAIGRRSRLSAAMLHTAIDETKHPHIRVVQAFERSMGTFKELEERGAHAMRVCAKPQGQVLEKRMIAELCSQVQELHPMVGAAGHESKNRFNDLNASYIRNAREQDELLNSVR